MLREAKTKLEQALESCRTQPTFLKVKDRLTMRVEPLFQKEDVPEEFWEPCIQGSYRHPQSSADQCLRSIFQGHNETLNVWTHFLSTWFFMWQLTSLAQTHNFREDPYTWPVLPYLCGICLYSAGSAFAHTFNAMSVYARHVCFLIDYLGLCFYAFSVSLAHIAYALPVTWMRPTGFYLLLLPTGFVIAILSSVGAGYSRLLPSGFSRRALLLGSLSTPAVYCFLPLLYRLAFEEESVSAAMGYHKLQIIWGTSSAVVYALHFPEKVWPGKCDVIGHSHQWFHICSFIATYFQMQGILSDMTDRRDWLVSKNTHFPGLVGSIGAACTLLMFVVCVAVYYSMRYKVMLERRNNNCKHTCSDAKKER